MQQISKRLMNWASILEPDVREQAGHHRAIPAWPPDEAAVSAVAADL